MKLPMECRAVPPGPAGNSKPRLLFAGGLWAEWDLTFCIHSEKLRLGCDECDEHFERNPQDVPAE